MLREKNTVCPGWKSHLRSIIIVFCSHIILEGWVKQQLAFLAGLELVIFHTMQVKFVFCHQSLIVFVGNLLIDLFLRHSYAEVEVAEVNLDIVIVHQVVLVLGASFTDVALRCNLCDLLLSRIDVLLAYSSS